MQPWRPMQTLTITSSHQRVLTVSSPMSSALRFSARSDVAVLAAGVSCCGWRLRESARPGSGPPAAWGADVLPGGAIGYDGGYMGRCNGKAAGSADAGEFPGIAITGRNIPPGMGSAYIVYSGLPEASCAALAGKPSGHAKTCCAAGAKPTPLAGRKSREPSAGEATKGHSTMQKSNLH